MPRSYFHKDFKKAQHYFSLHPEASVYSYKESDLPNTYIRFPDGKILRLYNQNDATKRQPHILGKGNSGTVYLAADIHNNLFAVKVLSGQRTQLHYWEAEFCKDLGIATNNPAIHFDPDQRTNDIFIPMYVLGTNLKSYMNELNAFKPSSSIDLNRIVALRLSLSINLLLAIHRLHSGEQSLIKRQYAHLDVKPQNVFVDTFGQILLADFGEACIETKGLFFYSFTGTPSYIPVSKREDLYKISSTITNQQADFFATLRTIYHPKISLIQEDSIFNQEAFSKLPTALKVLLDTHNPREHFSLQNPLKNELFLASVLIKYVNQHYQITQEEIDTLEQNVTQQKTLVAAYERQQQTRIINAMDAVVCQVEVKLRNYQNYLVKRYQIAKDPTGAYHTTSHDSFKIKKYEIVSALLIEIEQNRSNPHAALNKIKSCMETNYDYLSQHTRIDEDANLFIKLLNSILQLFASRGNKMGESILSDLETLPSTFYPNKQQDDIVLEVHKSTP